MLQIQCQFYMLKSLFIGHERIENITFIMLYVLEDFSDHYQKFAK